MDRDWAIIIALGIGWGTSFYFNELMLRDMGPLSVSVARTGMAALTGWAWLVMSGQSWRVPTNAIFPLIVLGALMFAFPFAIYPLGQQFVASSVAGIVNALTPLMVVVISHYWPGGERATPLKVAGVFAGFLGIIFLTIPAFEAEQSSELYGTFIILLAPISYACALNWIRKMHGLNMVVVATWAFSFASLLLLPWATIAEGAPEAIQPTTWFAIFVIGVVLTGISFMVAFSILPRVGATKTSSVTFIAPVSALLVGWALLDERLEFPHFIGMAAIFLGLFLLDGRLFGRKVN